MPSPSEVVFAAFRGALCIPPHDSSRHSGTGVFASWSRNRHDCPAIRLHHYVVTYKKVKYHLWIDRGFCLLILRQMHLASMDGLSSRRCEWRTRFTPFTPFFYVRNMTQQLNFACCIVSAPQPINSLRSQSLRTSIPPSALHIRPYSPLLFLPAILHLLNYFFTS